ncbi:FliM/FliN family flagellar motor switch protein [Palleronia sp. KMU-117]|uniref:FliM/FliN family flagellar motor switch protein n=1 Tax=Palleronia sp. KMU-117 TaxID=3434108 RepID=UPI003D73397B
MDEAEPPATGTSEGTIPFSEVPIEIRISVGHARPRIRELLALTHDSVLTLDRGVNDPVELYVGDLLIARGELEEIEGDEDGALAVRLIEVIDPGAR